MIHKLMQPMNAGRVVMLEIGQGDTAEITLARRGQAVAAEAVFGRREGDWRRPMMFQMLAGLEGGQSALWETQRCTIPVAGYSVRAGATGTVTRWAPGEPGIVHLAGLHSVGEFAGRLRSSFSVLTGTSLAGEVHPLYLVGVEAQAWLDLPAHQACRPLAARWAVPPARGRQRRHAVNGVSDASLPKPKAAALELA